MFFLAILSFFYGCKKDKDKDGGKLVCTMTYNVSSEKKGGKNLLMADSIINHYSQFGDFITSITPSRFIGKFLHIRLTNWQEGIAGGEEFNIDLFDNQIPLADPQRLADFSNNSSVSFAPESINVSNDKELIYFIAVCLFFYQEFELPAQYENFPANYFQFLHCEEGLHNNFESTTMGIEKTGRHIKASHENFVAPVFDPNWTGFQGTYPVTGHTYVFGNTDSTFIFDNGTTNPGKNNDNPMGQPGYIVRSNKFNPITISPIPAGETKTIYGIMSFNTSDLIQIYAGADNTPYTSDDIFVYVPNFWERVSITLEYY